MNSGQRPKESRGPFRYGARSVILMMIFFVYCSFVSVLLFVLPDTPMLVSSSSSSPPKDDQVPAKKMKSCDANSNGSAVAADVQATTTTTTTTTTTDCGSDSDSDSASGEEEEDDDDECDEQYSANPTLAKCLRLFQKREQLEEADSWCVYVGGCLVFIETFLTSLLE